ncbi:MULTISPECIES: histidine phosphatase family protein [Mycobacterium]|uniref:Histidine phosphatase family protein n=1 Tax=Mycobacterium gordonae TaxID=1778 RepID=A0A1A6B8D5_MYCGO|nr:MULTISPECIES: histidine phosphatase family protein [Mycobacterium]MBI2699014.1 histidine phosphatase family protein [Mycobacterium sp.]MBX9978004.1 phosphoglycerate mutase family protein [Mycobacterium gordonae]MCQ4363067.1 phosphoglycerate mutase family protein [Mycobacterium gordonae]MCV7009811.1 histidine phosphatase family protein [Mycobacterium gordonae]OBR98611.1 hypothetical protein A9W98_34530 [Mycobacterium gordonae]
MVKRALIRRASQLVAVAAAAVLLGACSSSPQARSITITFIRNAQTQANADGIIDTAVPGPSLTADGKGQAQQLAHQVGHTEFDALYSSPMAADQQTAGPLATEVGRQVAIEQGLQSIDAGWYNGKPESMANSTYMLAPVRWVDGDVDTSIPGSVSGSDFNSRFSGAIRKIYDSGHNKPAVFSQGTAIMVWTLMNVKNPKLSLLNSHPLPNVGRVVITGNPVTGWTLVDWDGVRSFN